MRMFKKILRLFIIGIIAIIIAIPVSLGLIKKMTGDTNPPATMTAPWGIKTTSRIYYGEKFSIQNGTPELDNYWTLDNNKYTYHKGIIAFPVNSYGKFGTDVILVQRLTQATTP